MIGLADVFAGRVGMARRVPCTYFGEGRNKIEQDRRLGHRNIVRTENDFHLRRECGEKRDGFGISGEIGFRTIQPDGGGIVGVAGKEKFVATVKEREGIGSVAGSKNDLDGAAAEVDDFAVLNEMGNFPGTGAVGFGGEVRRKVAANLPGGKLGLSVFAGTHGILAVKV